MLPASPTGLLVFLVALAPGYAFVRVVERRAPQTQRSALLEAVDLLCVGALSTSAALLAVLGLGEVVPRALVALPAWTAGGSTYLVANPWKAVGSGALALALSILASAGLGLLTSRGGPGRLRPGSVWHATFRPAGSRRNAGGGGPQPSERDFWPPFLAVETKDGRVFEGFVRAFSTDESGQHRELTLQAPLFLQDSARQGRIPLSAGFVVIDGEQIQLISGSFPPRPRPEVSAAEEPGVPAH